MIHWTEFGTCFPFICCLYVFISPVLSTSCLGQFIGRLSLLAHAVAAVTYYRSVTILFSFRLELLQAREKKKEEEVAALKHSMQSGMVSLYVIPVILFNIFPIIEATENCACSPLSMFEFLGSSNEGTSSAQGRDGLPVQDWQLGGGEIKLYLSFNCNFQ